MHPPQKVYTHHSAEHDSWGWQWDCCRDWWAWRFSGLWYAAGAPRALTPWLPCGQWSLPVSEVVGDLHIVQRGRSGIMQVHTDCTLHVWFALHCPTGVTLKLITTRTWHSEVVYPIFASSQVTYVRPQCFMHWHKHLGHCSSHSSFSFLACTIRLPSPPLYHHCICTNHF